MLSITNRSLEVATSFTHPQIKRWAVAFLDADKESGQHSGIARTYSFEQAARIYFGGHLVQNLLFTLTEARQILDDITGWINEKGWRIEELVTFEQTISIGKYVVVTNYPWVDLEINIGAGGQDRFFYDIKIVSYKKRMTGSDKYHETYERVKIGSAFIQSIEPSRFVSIVSLVEQLANGLAHKGSQ